MAKSTTLANSLLNYLLRAVALSAEPASYWLALFDSTGTELVGDGYARVEIVRNTTNFSAASGKSCSNAVTITYAAATADWDPIHSAKLMDAETAGNVKLIGERASGADPFEVLDGQQFYLEPGDLVFTEV